MIRLFLILLVCGSLTAEHRQYRIVNPDLTFIYPRNAPPPSGVGFSRGHLPLPAVEYDKDFVTTYIEFRDTDGRLFGPQQMELTRREIEKAKNCDAFNECHPVAVFVYVHGWNNNASEKSDDVPRFRLALTYFANQINSHETNGKKKPKVIGIYIGWRGGTLKAHNAILHPFGFLTYWSRKEAARRMSGIGPVRKGAVCSEAPATPPDDSLPGVLDRIAFWVRRGDAKDESRLYAIGHSFGARVLEGAIHESSERRELIKALCDGRDKKNIWLKFNLVLLVNPASDSAMTRRTIKEIQEAAAHNRTPGKSLPVIRHPDYDAGFCNQSQNAMRRRCLPYPAMIEIASLGDFLTRRVLPAANLANFVPPFRLLAPNVSGRLRSAPFSKDLQTHKVERCPSAGTQSNAACAPISFQLPLNAFQWSGVRPKANPSNAAVWIMTVDKEVVQNHGDIWNLNTASMIASLIGDPNLDASTPAPPPPQPANGGAQ